MPSAAELPHGANVEAAACKGTRMKCAELYAHSCARMQRQAATGLYLPEQKNSRHHSHYQEVPARRPLHGLGSQACLGISTAFLGDDELPLWEKGYGEAEAMAVPTFISNYELPHLCDGGGDDDEVWHRLVPGAEWFPGCRRCTQHALIGGSMYEEGGSEGDGDGAPIEFRTPWLQPPCIEASMLPACLALLFPLLVSDSLNFYPSGPSPCMVGILAGLFSLLHLASIAWRAAFSAPAGILSDAVFNASTPPEPTRPAHLNPVRSLLWAHVFADFTFAHLVFVLLICFLPWQARKLNLWTDNWTGLILRQKRRLTGSRFALARLLANCAPRHNLVDLLDPYYGNPLGLVSQGYDDTGVMAVSIRAGSTVRGRLERHNSLSSNSNRSREATVVADCVRRLNKLICLIDDLASCGFPQTYHSGDRLIDDTLKALEKDSEFMSTFSDHGFPTLLKVYCVGPTLVFASGLCPPHSEGNCTEGDHLVHLAYFAQLLKRVFDELRSQAKRSDDLYYVEIGLHVGPTIMGIVGQARPKLVVVEETLRYALCLASQQQSTTDDGSTLYEGLSIERSMILASTRFVSALSKSHLADPLPVSAARRIELDGDCGLYVWPSEVCELERFGSFMRHLKTCLSPTGRDHQQHPLRQRGSVDRQERAASHLMDTKVNATFVTPSTYRRLHHRMSEQLVVSCPQKSSPLPSHPAAFGGGGDAGDPASSVPPPPPLPPHKRTYVTAGEVVLNASGVNHKFASPTSRPEAAAHRDMGILRSPSVDAPDTPVWAEHYSSSSIKPPSDMQDTVDRGRFVTPVQIVNGYAQPHLMPPSPSPVMGFSRVHGMTAPTQQSPELTSIGQSIQQTKSLKASPYCVTNNIHDTLDSSFIRAANPVSAKSTNVYAVPGRFNGVQDPPSHGKEAVFLEVPRSPDLRPESMNSEDLFLAAERACASSVGEVTSLSSKNLSDVEADANAEQGSPGFESASVGLSAPRLTKKLNASSETTDSFHHNNPLYTDNEYESLAESHNNLLIMDVDNHGAVGQGVSEVPWTLPSCCPDLDAGMQWLRDVRMSDAPTQLEQFDAASRSVIASEVTASDGPIFPDYKRPSTPLGILQFSSGLSYDPPASFGAFLPTTPLKHSPSQPTSQQQFQSYPFGSASSTSDAKIGCLPSATFKTSASLDLVSTRVIPSVGRQSDYDGMTTDFGDDEATQNSPSASVLTRSEMDEEMTRPPSGMESSWMSEKDRSCEFSGSNIPPGQPDTVDCCGMEPCTNDQMTDSLLVETGGPIEDDLSEFSCAPSSVSKAASCCRNGDCYNLPRGGHLNEPLNGHRGDYAPPSDASLPPNSVANGDEGKCSCLPDIAPVHLPNFQCTRADGFSNMLQLTGAYDNLPQLREVYRPLTNGEVYAAPTFQSHVSFSPAEAKLSGTYCSEYDKCVNSFSGRGSERRPPQQDRLGDYSRRLRHGNVAMLLRRRLDAALQTSVMTPPGHQYQQRNQPTGWKPGRSAGRSRASPLPLSVITPFDAEIVNEARRICQRFQALGWRSVLSVDSEDQEPVSYSDSLAPSVGSSKPLFLLPDPLPVRQHPPVAAAVSPSFNPPATTGMNSEAFESDFADTDFEPNRNSQPKAHHHGSRLLIPWSLASGHARSQSVDCLTSATFDVDEELLREADFEGDFLSSGRISSGGASDVSSESVAPSSAIAGTSFSSSSAEEEEDAAEEEKDEESKADTVPPVLGTHQHSGKRRRCRRPHCSLLRRRAAQVRRLLPLELQPYVMPGCVSSVSPSTRHSSPPLSRRPSVCRSTVVGTAAAGRPSGLGLRLLCIRTPHRSASDPQLGLRATNFSVSLHFGEKSSLFTIRYQCLKLVKNDADDFLMLAIIGNRKCENFKLRSMTEDQFKCLVFVCALQAPCDTETRTRLLSKIEQDPDSTLQTLTAERQRIKHLN
ncbi:unnamed protein product [Schistocephalus solidus]|uniref:Guanylate cyclase domain-containing protein n=1 Tax=Schistocephalus solidus TaxID=70667 RepID=A0A183T5H9_SCHSO|nr:unnamed protein product [Schistocephalus solidus]